MKVTQRFTGSFKWTDGCEFSKHFTLEGISLVERGFKVDLLVTGEITNLCINLLNYMLSYKRVL